MLRLKFCMLGAPGGSFFFCMPRKKKDVWGAPLDSSKGQGCSSRHPYECIWKMPIRYRSRDCTHPSHITKFSSVSADTCAAGRGEARNYY
eukprot:1176059-Prorocentrum_minimum.AAC.1